MPTIVNKRSYAFAQGKIKNGTVVLDQRDDWSEQQPSAGQENEFIEAHGWDEYANWHLGVDDEASEHTKATLSLAERAHLASPRPQNGGIRPRALATLVRVAMPARHAELAPVLDNVETGPMSAGLMIANVAAYMAHALSLPCAVTRIYTHRGCVQGLPAQDCIEAARPGRRLQRVIASSLVVSRRPPRVRRGWLSGSRVNGRRCNRCSPPRGLAWCGMSRVS
jgi:hypothetical protein